MSLRRSTTISNSGQPFYYIYLHNLPNKYITSNIFPEVILSQQIRDDILQQEINVRDSFCWFGFKTKQISSKFQRQMKNLLPSFVVISRRQMEVSQQLKQQKEDYDERSQSTNISFNYYSNRSFNSSFNKSIHLSNQQYTQQLSLSQSSDKSSTNHTERMLPSIPKEKPKRSSLGFLDGVAKTCSEFITNNTFFDSLWRK